MALPIKGAQFLLKLIHTIIFKQFEVGFNEILLISSVIKIN